jgi:hypothetical protein
MSQPVPRDYLMDRGNLVSLMRRGWTLAERRGGATLRPPASLPLADPREVSPAVLDRLLADGHLVRTPEGLRLAEAV